MIAPNDNEAAGRREQAAEWCWRVADGDLNADDQRDFSAWMLDLENRAAFEEMVTVWQGTDAIAEMPGFLALRAKALSGMDEASMARVGRRAPRRWWVGGAVAASLVAAVAVSTAVYRAQPDVYATNVGERRVVRLEDGSRVSLDASSKVDVRYADGRRTLDLLAGRAKFEVAHDPMRPFSVTAGNKTIVATGTAFSVELIGDQVHVVLYQGHVAVLDKSDTKVAPQPVQLATRAAAADQFLNPGNELVAPLDSASATIAPVDPVRTLSWEGGRLSFSDEPLATAVQRINRYADKPVVVGDAAAGRLVINGVFDAGDTNGFVSGVASLFPVKVSEETDRVVISSR